jgi:SAM-dependent methyltransferase
MAQEIVRRFVADVDRALHLPPPIVEFGALQVEADQDADLRPLFRGRKFIGTDMRPGPGVDRVEDLRRLSLADDSAGSVLCLDTLEHCEDPVSACRELARVTAPGGVAVISSVMLFPIHGYPSDYFRFTPEGFRSLLGGFDHCSVGGIGDPEIPFQVLGVATNGRPLDLEVSSLPSVAAAQREWEAGTRVRLGPFRYGRREIVSLVGRELLRTVRHARRS